MSFVELNREADVAILTLNRPEAMNALHLEMLTELDMCLKDLARDEAIKIVVLRGNGGAFCAGGDIKFMMQAGSGQAEFYKIMDIINSISLGLYTLPKLCLAAVHGAAAGLGLSFALASDRVVAQNNAKIAMNFVGIGLIPDGGGHFHMQKRLGETRAKQVVWNGEVMSAAKALEIGLIDETADDLEQAVSNILGIWKTKPLQSMIRSKSILSELNRTALEKTLELEKQGQYAMRMTQDHQEGIRAFVEKRKPAFRGN